jgi:putative NADH-flavin reductase
MNSKKIFLVFGASGRTGRHFVTLALQHGHKVRALVRNSDKIKNKNANLDLHQGSISDFDKMEELVSGVDFVISMLGDAELQKNEKINTIFVTKLVPAMRKFGVKRFLYQAGGFTSPYKKKLPLMTWLLKNTLARFGGLIGQHKDNEAVIEYLVEQAKDIEWVVHRAAIASDGPSKGILKRSKSKLSIAPFVDCAAYSYQIIQDQSAIHTYDLSCYGK